MTKVLIYGVRQQAEQLCFYIENERCAEVAAFVVDKEYRTLRTLMGHPVVTFEEALAQYPPESCEMAVSFAYQHMVHDRRVTCLKCREAGYTLFNFISKHATFFAGEIGQGNIVYPGCHIAFGVTIGNGNFFETGVTIAHHTHIGNWNFFAPAATVCGSVSIGENNFIGSNSTTMDSAVIGKDTLVAAGAVVRETEDLSVYFPGRTTKWHGESSEIKI